MSQLLRRLSCSLLEAPGAMAVTWQLWEMLVPLQSYNIIQLFLIANLVTTTSTLPVLAGLIRHRLAYRCVSFVRCRV